ncbi:thioredoxin family protein [Polaribacter sargassicola]|uniref:thioredoxin family protein n=1 Tax=Polaribacter sargassicola TaxID=2836891 RepID=UPI001F1F09D4|nr:thioredoxin family protein [Polaribacter sp. DS7-9]MCG1036512.1 thioredoxin family protein [Polaribacter sp. DS7-9]
MKILINITLLLFFIQVVNTQEVLVTKEWKEAKELAKKENKQILIILTGSEWCIPCKKMDKKVIKNPEFENYAEQNLVIFLIDLPGGGLVINSKVYQDYEKFKNKYQSNTLPSLILTKSDGTKIKTLKGKMYRIENVMKQLKQK